MKILVFSDSHGNPKYLASALREHKGTVDLAIHLGDGLSDMGRVGDLLDGVATATVIGDGEQFFERRLWADVPDATVISRTAFASSAVTVTNTAVSSERRRSPRTRKRSEPTSSSTVTPTTRSTGGRKVRPERGSAFSTRVRSAAGGPRRTGSSRQKTENSLPLIGFLTEIVRKSLHFKQKTPHPLPTVLKDSRQL